jgi:20S proteasome alpha/beta subunit
MSRVDGHVAVAVAGITADANTLVEYLRIQVRV